MTSNTITTLELLRDQFQDVAEFLARTPNALDVGHARQAGHVDAYRAVVSKLDEVIASHQAVEDSLAAGESHGVSEDALAADRALTRQTIQQRMMEADEEQERIMAEVYGGMI